MASSEDSVVLYSCYHCSNKFMNYRALDSHIKLISIKELEASLQKNATSVFQHHCLMVDIVVDDEYKKKTQLKANIKNYEIEYNCPLCSYRYIKSSQLRNHVALMHSCTRPSEKLFSDHPSIDRRESKQQEKRTHSRKKCKLCDYKGNNTLHHMIKHHAKDGYFMCYVCNFKSVSAFLLNKHIKHNHRN